jgi:hypothetical protein
VHERFLGCPVERFQVGHWIELGSIIGTMQSSGLVTLPDIEAGLLALVEQSWMV